MTTTMKTTKRNTAKNAARLNALLPAGEYTVWFATGAHRKLSVSSVTQLESALYQLTYDLNADRASIFNANNEEVLQAVRTVGRVVFEE